MWRQSHVSSCKYTWPASIIPPPLRLFKIPTKQPTSYCLVVSHASLAITLEHTLHKSNIGTPLAHSSCRCNWLSYITGWAQHKRFQVMDEKREKYFYAKLTWRENPVNKGPLQPYRWSISLNQYNFTWASLAIGSYFILKLKIIWKVRELTLNSYGIETMGLGTTSGPTSYEFFMAAYLALTMCVS